MIQVTSKREGFRRAGIAHSSTPAIYPDDHFTKEQMQLLESEPMLIIHRLPNPKKEAPKGGDPLSREQLAAMTVADLEKQFGVKESTKEETINKILESQKKG